MEIFFYPAWVTSLLPTKGVSKFRDCVLWRPRLESDYITARWQRLLKFEGFLPLRPTNMSLLSPCLMTGILHRQDSVQAELEGFLIVMMADKAGDKYSFIYKCIKIYMYRNLKLEEVICKMIWAIGKKMKSHFSLRIMSEFWNKFRNLIK